MAGENNAYAAPGSTTWALVSSLASSSTRNAAGTVEAIAPSIETTSGDFHVQYQGDLIVGKLAMGADTLRVSVAGVLRAA